ncbi:MAG: ABC transporter ATP-binding protein [bacterium]
MRMEDTGRIILSCENICAAYHKKEVLKNVSVNIKDGEIVALIGPNGAGKSTLLKVIIGFLRPTMGRIIYDNKDITDYETDKKVSAGIGYFIQGGEVYRSMTVDENLKMGFVKRQEKERQNIILKEEVYELFPNLKEKKNKPASLLSGGERQALALSIILLTNPRVLLLDEPSAGLAPTLVKDVLKKILVINKRWGITILIVEQNVREVLDITQRVYVMKLGSIFKEGDTQYLLEEKILEKAFLE